MKAIYIGESNEVLRRFGIYLFRHKKNNDKYWIEDTRPFNIDDHMTYSGARWWVQRTPQDFKKEFVVIK
jgi:hypothetical protein